GYGTTVYQGENRYSLRNISFHQNKIEIKEKEIERNCINLYLSLLLMEEKIKSKKMEIELFSKMVKILEEEVNIGTKKPLDLIEGQQKLLESQIELQQLQEEYQLAIEDIYSIMKEPDRKKPVLFKEDLDSLFLFVILQSKNKDFQKQTIEDENLLLNKLLLLENIKPILISKAFDNNLELKSLQLKILQIKSRLEIVKLLFLKNIQLSLGIAISGSTFPPVNISSNIIFGISIDFGIFSGGVNITENISPSSSSISSESSLSGFNSLVLPDNEKLLLIELKTTTEKYEQMKGNIEKELDSTIIQFHSRIQKYFLELSKKNVMEKKKDIIETQLKIGEIKQVDYFNYLKELNNFYLSLKEDKNSILSLIFKLMDITQCSLEEIYYYLKN
ncbi:MAG: TolC family protein, partial [Spirochaetota bacterium]